jgi:hypothetical protein
MMTKTVLIYGAGQLGSRYLQGLVKCIYPLTIWVIDPSDASLAQAYERWKEVGGTGGRHSLHLVNLMAALPTEVDLAIVATTACIRADVVETLVSLSKVRFWVLEKVLAQSHKDLDRLIQYTARSEAAWVNIPRRMMRWHQDLAEQISKQSPTNIRIFGGNWGLACNSIHMLDLGAYLLNETLVSIDSSGLGCNWYESKRAGFFEVNGTLSAKYSGGKCVTLKCLDTDDNMTIEVETSEGKWQIIESASQAIAPDGQYFPGRLEYQSEMTARLVESILNSGSCQLPTVNQAVVLHRPFLNAFIAHWNQTQQKVDSKVPIT